MDSVLNHQNLKKKSQWRSDSFTMQNALGYILLRLRPASLEEPECVRRARFHNECLFEI